MILRPQLLLLAATLLAHFFETSPKRQDAAHLELSHFTQSSSAIPQDFLFVIRRQTTDQAAQPSTRDMTTQTDTSSRKIVLPQQATKGDAIPVLRSRTSTKDKLFFIQTKPADARRRSLPETMEQGYRNEYDQIEQEKYRIPGAMKTIRKKQENREMSSIKEGPQNRRETQTVHRAKSNSKIKSNHLDQGFADAVRSLHTDGADVNKDKTETLALRQGTLFTRKPFARRYSSSFPPTVGETHGPLRKIRKSHPAAKQSVHDITPATQRTQRLLGECLPQSLKYTIAESITQISSVTHEGSFSCQPCKCHRDDSGGLVADCRHLGLPGVPSTIPADVSQLLFSRNNLAHVHSSTFERFKQLKLLDLSSNAIISFDSTAFKGLGCLQTLYLHKNKLLYFNDVFLKDLFTPLRSLRRLTLHGNSENTTAGMCYPDQALSRLISLEALSMDGLTKMALGTGFLGMKSLKNLSFSDEGSFCAIGAVLNGTFANVPSLQLLNISGCKLHFLDSASLSPLKQIDTVDISNNMFLGFPGMQNATHGLRKSKLRVFMANALYEQYSPCVVLSPCHVKGLSETPIQELYIDGNNMQFIEPGVFPILKDNVEKISARGNQFIFGFYVFEFAYLKKITYANLHADNLRSLPELPHFYHLDHNFKAQESCPRPSAGCCELDVDYTPEYTTQEFHELRRIGNDMLGKHGVFYFPIPKSLREVDMSQRGLDYNILSTSFTINNSLEILDLSSNLLKMWIGPVKQLRKLRKLNLSGNYASILQPTFFAYLESLEVLNISHNQLSAAIADDVEGAIFANLSTLLLLDISNNGIWNISRSVFQDLQSLELLYMAGNRLPAEMMIFNLSHMSNLRLLDLSSNALESIPRATRGMLDELARRSNFSLELIITNNPFSCSCNNRDFLQWLRLTPVRVVARKQLWCQFGNGATGPMWRRLEELGPECVSAVLTAAVLGSVVLVLLLAGLTVYRYRWKLRYLYHVARGHYRDDRQPLGQFRFDAFIACAEEDEAWVAGELLQQLEDVHGLRLCVPHRDFHPGRPLTSSLVEAVVSSRRTVLVLSPAFLASPWCEFQIQIATMEGVHTGRDVALPLIYDHVCMRTLPREVLFHMHGDAYMEFPRDPRCRAFFWDNLAMALRQP